MFLRYVFLWIFRGFSGAVCAFGRFPTTNRTVYPIQFGVEGFRVFLSVGSHVSSGAKGSLFWPPISRVVRFLSWFQVLPIRVQLFLYRRVGVVFVHSQRQFPTTSTGVEAVVAQQVSVLSFSRVRMVHVFSFQVHWYFLGPFVFIEAVVSCRVRSGVRISLFHFHRRFVGFFRHSGFFNGYVVVYGIVTLVCG